MTGGALRELRCGNCGADVPLTSPATVVVTCPHCGVLSRRTDVDLREVGTIALPTPLASHFRIGTAGRWNGRGFTVRGQLQLDHGAGPWNEWAAEADDGGWLWIAEAQGEVYVFEEVEPDADTLAALGAKPLPEPGAEEGDAWRAGDRVSLGSDRWLVVEVGRGTVLTCRGELPIDPAIGSTTSYLDLALSSRRFATADFTRDAVELLVGERLPVAELELDPLTQPDHRPERVAAADVTCPECGGTIEVQDPEHALTLVCAHCGSTLEPVGDAREAYVAVEARTKLRWEPALPLGARGTLGGEDVTVLGALVRRVRAEGRWWPWREYLLRCDDGAYRWLAESDGHWTFLRPISPAAVEGGALQKRVGGTRFKHFTTGRAEVHRVLGEFYWSVRQGDRVRAQDYVSTRTGEMLSLEETPTELAATRGRYVPREEMEEAFPEADLPRASGVGACQPNPARPREAWATWVVLFVALMASCVWVREHHDSAVVYEARLGPTPAAPGEQQVTFSDEFELEELGNLRVRLLAPGVDQGWIGLTGALVDVESGEVTTFATSAQYYHGVSDGERWTEGDRTGTTFVGSVEPGRYRLRLAAEGWDKGVNRPYEVRVRTQVPRVLWFALAFLGLLAIPLLTSFRWFVREHARWSKSDHPWGESE